MRPEDIITRVDETPVKQGGDLRRVLRAMRPGGTARFTVNRGGRNSTVTVTLGEAAD